MFIRYRTKGFILKKTDFGEADQLFTIFTKDFGKLEILGKGIRKISSKLRSGAEIFYLSEIEFIQGKIHKTLTDAILIEKFKNLRKDLNRLSIAYKISEILDSLIKGPEPDEKIWFLLNQTFQKLNDNQIPNSKLPLIFYYFFWNLISILGYQPSLYQCSICQKKLEPKKLYFNEKERGIICPNCFKRIKEGKEISTEAVKILRIILKENFELLLKLKVEKEIFKSLESISKDYLSIFEKEK